MLLIVILAAIALAAVAFVAWAVRGTPRFSRVEDLESRLHQIDLPAFLNLTGPDEVSYLARSLAPRSFRRVQRQRIIAPFHYLNALSTNAAILMRIGDLAANSDDPETAQSGRALTDAALRTRLLALRAYGQLIPQWFFPSAEKAWSAPVIAHYDELKRRLVHLVSVQHPIMTSRSVDLL